MKYLKSLSLLLVLTFVLPALSFAKKTIAVVNFDVIGGEFQQAQYISMISSEIRKLDTIEVIDKYTAAEALEKYTPEGKKCFGAQCLANIGKQLGVDYILSGSAEITSDKFSLHLRIINPNTEKVSHSNYSEYLYSDENIWKFMQMSTYKLFGKKVKKDDLVVFDFDIAKSAELEGPRIKHYNLSGPRFGGSLVTGNNSRILQSDRAGGFNKSPFMTVMGYQYEKSYLYTGQVQALVQLNFSITGLDQQMAIPSLSLVHGFRLANSGWEIGFGPIFRTKKVKDGFVNDEGIWTLADDAPNYNGVLSSRLDSRGNLKIQTGWLWAIGKSFKAGNMNIPINFYAIPDNQGWLYGVSVGYALHK